MSVQRDDGDDGPGAVTATDHAFIPRDEWWSLCIVCGLAESAHATTTLAPNPEHLERRPEP